MIKFSDIFNEDAVVAADAAAADSGAGEVSTPTNNTSDDDAEIVKNTKTGQSTEILGKDCDHHKKGYLGPGCFHVPGTILAGGKKKKKKKNPYEKGMTLVIQEDDDFNSTISTVKKLKEHEIIEQMQSSFPAFAENITNILAVFLSRRNSTTEKENMLFVKAKTKKNNIVFVHCRFDKGKFIVKDGEMFNSRNALKEYEALQCPKNGQIIWSVEK